MLWLPILMASAGLQLSNVFLVLGYPNWAQYSRCGLIHIKQGKWPLVSAHWLKPIHLDGRGALRMIVPLSPSDRKCKETDTRLVI